MLKLLITSGGTREPIDEVRFVSNVSTGSTGAALANALLALGHEVTLLRGQASVPAAAGCHSELFGSAEDLRQRLQARLATQRYDAVIMCAAVADYRPESFVAGKIRSDADELLLRLVRTPKILPSIKSFATPAPVVIGFKLTVGADQAARAAAVNAQFAAGGVDAVVQNDLHEIRKAPVHPFHFYSAPGQVTPIGGTTALAALLARFIAERGSPG